MTRLRLFLFASACWVACPGFVRADAQPGDPLAYDLRIAISPVAFQAGISQSWFGSAVRAEYGISSRLDIGARARFAWWPAASERETYAYHVALSGVYHFSQELEDESLAGTVYADDPPALRGPGSTGTDQDLMDIPVSERMRSGSPTFRDRDMTLVAAMRKLHSLRFGVGYSQLVERALPDPTRSTRNRLAMLHLGYGWGTHWNLPASLTGKREIGYRRFYVDALLTAAPFVQASPDRLPSGSGLDLFPVGLRIGLEGAIDALLDAAPGVGFAYDLELGAYPGQGGLEGYLMIELGLAIDVATR